MLNPPASLFDRLPNELLKMITDGFELFDIECHVHFHETSSHISAFYGENDQFWRTLCFMNGMGHDQELTLTGTPKLWRDIARERVEHADTCRMVYCGPKQLRSNRAKMLHALQQFPQWTTHPYPVDLFQGPDSEICDILSGRVVFRRLHFVEFSDKIAQAILDDAPPEEACLQCAVYHDDFPIPHMEFIQPLANHPVALYSFATFPPISRMSFTTFHLPSIENEHGVTIANICDIIVVRQYDPLDAATICHYVDCGELEWGPGTFGIPPDWDTRDTLDHTALGSLCGWFRIGKWNGLQHKPADGENTFSLVFSPTTKLPPPREYRFVSLSDIPFHDELSDLHNAIRNHRPSNEFIPTWF